MGRITIFTGNDVNSKMALRELERRELPYTEISLAAYPDRFRDAQAAADVSSVPQVFLNTRYVGGVNSLKKELRRWDRSSRYATPLEKYEAEIAIGFDPSNERLALPSGEPKVMSHAALMFLSSSAVKLPDGTMTSLRDITEKLKNTLPTMEVRRNGVMYNHVFSGDVATEVFTTSLGVSRDEAVAFGNTLMADQVIQPLKVDKISKKFADDASAHYRLQCFQEPAVLNSYCIHESPVSNPTKLVADLIHLLDNIEMSSVNSKGQLDYSMAMKHELFPLFEESVCELQTVNTAELSQKNEVLAFALNVYLLMIRYSCFKVGIPLSEADRLQFLSLVNFNVGGTLYSFEEWTVGMMGRPKKNKAIGKIEASDTRCLLAIHTGVAAGSSHSLPFSVFEANLLDTQLTLAAKVFLGDAQNMTVNRKKGIVEMSNLFKLNRSNWKGVSELELLEATLNYLNGKKKSDVTALVESKSFRKIKYIEPKLGRHTGNSLWFDKESLEVDKKGLRGVLKRFRPPKAHRNERARLATLHSLNVLDSLDEERYDRITTMVRDAFNVPLVFVSLVDQNRQWFKSTQWQTTACPRVPETGRDVSFCGHAIHLNEDEAFIIPNALEDERFADNPLVAGDLGIRFYAGLPLVVPSEDGHGTVNIGTLCIIDQQPREMSANDLVEFRKYAGMIKNEILRRDSSELGSSSGHSCQTSVVTEDTGSDWDEES